jgi:hypothetical protein
MGDIVATVLLQVMILDCNALTGELVKIQMKKKEIILQREFQIYRKASQKD